MTIIATPSGFTPWSQMIPEAAALVSECPNPIIKDALMKAMREFFSTSRAWRGRNLTLLTTVAAQESYDVNPPANAEGFQVLACFCSDVEIECEVPGEDDDSYPGEADSTYRIGVSADGASYELRPAPPAAGDVLKGSVAYTPAANATARPNKPATAREAYPMHRAKFEESIRDASNTAGPVRRRPLRVKTY